ncbi:hypothetical protein [Haloarcula litorea]|uniref:hypothetical protein n=1 Tax=Haloarcula litorea TaxID=3032579 RepID=UPI0023E8FBA1|nr:hypothetical protein [Halomicroarcula sp. GDY20]
MPSTRRRFLGAAAGALAATLAGCESLSGGGGRSTPAPGTGEAVTDYETASHVVDGEQSLFRWTGEAAKSDNHLLVTTGDERSKLSFETDGESPVAAFVNETDFEGAVVALFQRRHDACRRLGTFGLTRRPDALRVHICREPRPADVACSTDERRSTALAIRVPVAGDPPAELSVVKSSRCESRYGPRRSGGEG